MRRRYTLEISRRRRAEQEVQHLRLHDATTGLPNRDYMVELVAQRLASPRAAMDVIAVVHVRVDASGGVALGAEAPTADEVMTQVALRLRRFTSPDVELARVRADGFFIPARPQHFPANRHPVGGALSGRRAWPGVAEP